MADNPLTPEKMLRGSQNLDVWETATSGDENTDWTNLVGDKGPSLKKAIKTIMQKAPINSTPFATKAALIADTTLVDGAFAYVYNDDVSGNNGLYQKISSAWTYAKYNPLEQAKEYVRLATAYPQNFDGFTAYKSNGKLATAANATLFYQKIAVTSGDKFFIHSQDYDISKAWYIADKDLNIISESAGYSQMSDDIVTIITGGAWLYVNCPIDKKSEFALNKISDTDISILKSLDNYPMQKGIAYVSDGAARPMLQRVASPNVVSTVIDVRFGDKYLIDAQKIGAVKTYNFVANDMTIVTSESDNETNRKTVIAPQYAAKLIVCSDINYPMSIKKLDYVDDLTIELTKPKLKDFYPPQPSYKGLLKEKCPKFYDKFRNKSGDTCVVITGTSLTQGNLYATDRADATTRPPLLHTNDLSSRIYDVLIEYWHGQQHRRYDHNDLTYSASNWQVLNRLQDTSGNDVWDDFDYKKNGLTKTTTDANASVTTTIPSGAWQFNFIYRTDSQGGNCTVSITQGNGKVEAWNGTAWVEANGFVFTMLEPVATTTKGNTIYQKRLKMRCKNKAGGIDSLATAKTIKISKGNDASRFNVVGFEWSPREYMLTFINAARGSHAWGLTDSPQNLEYYQDGDVWEFNPDLILCEVTSINWGAGFGQSLNNDPNYYVNIAKKAYFNDLTVYPNSLYDKSAGYTKCEIVFYGDTVATSVDYDTLWDSNKQPKFGLVTGAAYNGAGTTENVGRVKTIFENYEEVELFVASKPYIFIPVVYQFKQLADKAYGNYVDAFAATGKDGASLSYDKVHLNTNGAAFWAYLITPLFANL